jgi:hypothetical protein
VTENHPSQLHSFNPPNRPHPLQSGLPAQTHLQHNAFKGASIGILDARERSINCEILDIYRCNTDCGILDIHRYNINCGILDVYRYNDPSKILNALRI